MDEIKILTKEPHRNTLSEPLHYHKKIVQNSSVSIKNILLQFVHETHNKHGYNF